MRLRSVMLLFDRYYYILMIPMAYGVIKLNLHTRSMQGIVVYYEDFKRIILSGFDHNAGLYDAPTFPMWGYGWLLILTENLHLLLVLQNVLATISVIIFIRSLTRHSNLSLICLRCIKFFFVFSLPWHAFHSVRWPYGISISLFLISFSLFLEAAYAEKHFIKNYVLSGICFGLLLNFRSDFILMPIGFAAIALIYHRFSRFRLAVICLWGVSIYACLVPWMLYTKHVTGHYLPTSTNGGAVLYCGLGVLDDNKWGITLNDSDPSMLNFLNEELGYGVGPRFVTYEGDRVLKARFLELIRDDPSEYGRKVRASFLKMYEDGVYSGDFWEHPDCYPHCNSAILIWWRQSVLKKPFLEQLEDWFSRKGIVVIMSDISDFTSRYVVKGAFLLLPVVLISSLKHRSLYLTLIVAGICYQILINSLLAHKAVSTAMMYPFFIVTLCVGTFILKECGYLLLKRLCRNR